MERRVMGNYHARCGAGEKPEVLAPEAYLSLFALPDDFYSLLSTMRKRSISCNIIIQNLAQIKAMNKDLWETITGNCDVFIYLGGNEQSTHEYVSKLLGKWTIDKRTHGESFGKNGNANSNYDVLGRELLMPDEVRKFPNNQCIVVIKGEDPVRDLKYQTLKDKNYKKERKKGDYISQPRESEEMKAMSNNEFTLYGEAGINYFKELADDGAENISILKITPEELETLDLSDFEEENIKEEDLEIFLEENRQTLLESAKVDELVKKELESKLAALNRKDNNLAYRLETYDYSAAQKEQAMQGLNNGLSEELVLTYFHPQKSVEDMIILRQLAEQTLKGD